MGKLKTERIVLYEQDERGSNIRGSDALTLDFKFDVNVSVDGMFTATLPEDVVSRLESAGIKLATNGRRNSKKGFYQDRSLPGLINRIKSECQEYLSKKIVSEKIVIKYSIETTCSYMIHEGGFIPNGAYAFRHSSENDYTWINGTLEIHAMSRKPFGFRIWTDVLWKRDYSYKSGVTKTFYDQMKGSDIDEKKQPYLQWLNGIVSITETDAEEHEIDYTEDSAKFFVDMYKAIFTINEKIKDFTTPEAILAVIESKQKLLS